MDHARGRADQAREVEQLQGPHRRVRRPSATACIVSRAVRACRAPGNQEICGIMASDRPPAEPRTASTHDATSTDASTAVARLQRLPAAADRADEEPGSDQADGLGASSWPSSPRSPTSSRAIKTNAKLDALMTSTGADAGGRPHRPHRHLGRRHRRGPGRRRAQSSSDGAGRDPGQRAASCRSAPASRSA